MRRTPENDTADMIAQLTDRLANLESEKQIDDTPVQIRVVSETEHSDDATESSVDTDPGWTWNESRWGFNVWG